MCRFLGLISLARCRFFRGSWDVVVGEHSLIGCRLAISKYMSYSLVTEVNVLHSFLLQK